MMNARIRRIEQMHWYRAMRARVRLAIMSPVFYIMVFLLTVNTHVHFFHSGIFPVVR